MKRNKKKKILLFPPHTKEVNRASIGDKSHPLRYLLSLFLFGTGRSLARKFFGWKRADPYIQAKYIKRTARDRERGRSALWRRGATDLEGRRKWWGPVFIRLGFLFVYFQLSRGRTV
jgi:hypothetical protein